MFEKVLTVKHKHLVSWIDEIIQDSKWFGACWVKATDIHSTDWLACLQVRHSVESTCLLAVRTLSHEILVGTLELVGSGNSRHHERLPIQSAGEFSVTGLESSDRSGFA